MIARKVIAYEEGWRERPYYCTESYPTVGYGFKVGDKNAPLPDFILPKAAGDAWLDAIIDSIREDLGGLTDHMGEDREAIIVSMCYQLGVPGCFKFKNMWDSISRKDWKKAAWDMLDSKWAKQTPARAQRHALTMSTGVMYDF